MRGETNHPALKLVNKGVVILALYEHPCFSLCLCLCLSLSLSESGAAVTGIWSRKWPDNK